MNVDDLVIGNVYKIKYHSNFMVLIRFINEEEVVMYDRKKQRNFFIKVEYIEDCMIEIVDKNVNTNRNPLKERSIICNRLLHIQKKSGLSTKNFCKKINILPTYLDNSKTTEIPNIVLETVSNVFYIDFKKLFNVFDDSLEKEWGYNLCQW